MNIDTLNAHCGLWLVHCPCLAQGRFYIHRSALPAHWALVGKVLSFELPDLRGFKLKALRTLLNERVCACDSRERSWVLEATRVLRSELCFGWDVPLRFSNRCGRAWPTDTLFFDLRLGKITRQI